MHLRVFSTEHSMGPLTLERTGVADSGVVDFYPDFVRLWWGDFDVFDGEIFACLPSHGGLYVVSIGHSRSWNPLSPHLTRNRLRVEKGQSIHIAFPPEANALTFPTVSAGIVDVVYEYK